jgi:hypothetical protein
MTLLRVGVGGACIVSPRRVASAAAGRPAVTLACVFTRILGVRQLVQAALTVTTPDLMTPLRGAVIDGLHAATMVLLAAVSRRHPCCAGEHDDGCHFLRSWHGSRS